MIPSDPRLTDRKVTACVDTSDGARVTFECGHSAIHFVPVPVGWSIICAQCVSEYLEEWRAAKGIIPA